MERIISLIVKSLLAAKQDSNVNITPRGLRFRPAVLYFWAYPADSGRELTEKYRVIAPRVAGSDLRDRKRIEHAFASRVRVRGQRQCHLPDDYTRKGTLVYQFLMAPGRA